MGYGQSGPAVGGQIYRDQVEEKLYSIFSGKALHVLTSRVHGPDLPL